MSCNECGEKPKKACGAFPKAVIEIDNPEKIVLLRKVMVPASMGDESTFPPTIGKYHNVLLEYEASGGIYLYSSDGIPTKLSSDVTELQAQLNALRVRIGEEEVARADADTALSDRITSLDDSLATVAKTGSYNDLSDKPTIGDGTLTIKKNGSNVGTFTANATTNTDVNIVVPTKTSDLANDGSDGASQYVESNDLATVATSGSYNDLTNKPNIGNATLTIKRNDTNAGTFTANATTNKSINIAVPTKTSDLTNDGADGTSTYVESDDLPTVDTTYSSSSNNAIANSTVTNSLDRNVMTNLAVGSTPSTTTVNLSNTKTNLAYPSSSTTSSISLPVASSTQAGVMNSATFDAVTNNTNNINAILNGAVAISNLPASPTQAQLTTAWENETGLTSLINRASVYDVTNNKVWTYYTNDQTWHAASNTSQVTVNTFTNSSEGTIKGSTNDGQVFAENDGTGSVNGWDTLTSTVSSNTSKLATIAQGAEVNVQANWTQTNTNADDYIKNKPANLVQDANYVHTDNNFTTTLKNKLDGIESGAGVNVQADWSQTDTSADDYIKNKPTIPTVNNATLTIQKNGTNVQTFTANSSTNKTANITVPTAVSELTNDASYATTTQLNNGLATKQNTLTAGDNIQINGDTISATDTTYTAGNAIDITNGEISADIHPADFFTAEDVISDCGSVLWLDDTMASTLKSVELKGDTYQQSYSGKNLLDCNTYSGKAPAADALTGEGYIKVTQNTTGSGGGNSFAYYDIDRADLANQQVTLFAKAVSGGGSTGSRIRVTEISGSPEIARIFPTTSGASDTFNMPADGKIRIYFYINASNVTGAVGAYTEYSEVQLELGAQATSFEPYVGGIPAPNPDYPQTVQVVRHQDMIRLTGKNLVNANELYLTNEVERTSDGLRKTITSSPLAAYYSGSATNPVGVYTVSFDARITNPDEAILVFQQAGIWGDNNIRLKDENGNYADEAYRTLNENWKRFSYTVNATISDTWTLQRAVMLYFSTYQNSPIFELRNFQIEIGSTATEFDASRTQMYPIDLRIGKNMLSIDFLSVGGLAVTGNVYPAKRYQINNALSPIKVNPNTTYTISANLGTTVMGMRVYVQECDAYTVPISGIWRQLASEAYTFTTSSSTEYIKLALSLSTTSTTVTDETENTTPFDTAHEWLRGTTLQVEEGEATAYEPYESIELCKIGSYQDYISKSGEDWYIHKEIGKLDVLSSNISGFNAHSGDYITVNYSDASVATIDSSVITTASNRFLGATNAQTWGGTILNGVSQGSNNNYLQFSLPNSTASTQAEAKTYFDNHPTYVYYALATSTDTQITNIDLVAQLNALAKAKSYNDQTNIIVITAGDNLPATLCVEAYRKSLSGVIEAIDNACTCRKNLVVHLPNGMTTYENNDAPIPIPEVLGALKRGQSVFLVDDGLPENVYVVTAASAEDGVWSMRADQTGINANNNDGYWHINGRDDLWRLVEFIPDTPGGEEVTHLVLSNPTTATWSKIGGIVTVYPTSVTVGIDTFASTDVVFTKDDDTTMTVGDLYTALTTGESFEIDLPFGEINAACYSGWSSQAAAIATVENVKLDGSNKQTLDVTSQGRLYEMYASSAPVMVNLPIPGSVLLDERFGVERLTIDDGDTVTSSYRFVVDTYKDTEPFN